MLSTLLLLVAALAGINPEVVLLAAAVALVVSERRADSA
jgi:hypothetical protein